MFTFIINLFNNKPNKTLNPYFGKIYNEQYRSAYSKLWIENLRDYYP